MVHGSQDDLHHVAVCARGAVALEHLGQLDYQSLDLFVVRAGHLDPHKSRERQAHFLRIYLGAIASDDACFLHPPHPLGRRRCREVDPTAHFFVVEPGVVLQLLQDAPPRSVQ